MSSAILYVAIVAIWIGVLVPRWLRHDTSRSGTTGLRRFSRHFGGSGEADDRERAGFDPEGRPRYTSFVPPAPTGHTPESHPESEIHHEEKVSSVVSGNRESMAQLYEADAPVSAGSGSAGSGRPEVGRTWVGPIVWAGPIVRMVGRRGHAARADPAEQPAPGPGQGRRSRPGSPARSQGPARSPGPARSAGLGGRRPARPGRGRRARRLLRRRGGRGRAPGRDGPQPSPDALDAGRADRRGYRPGRRAPVLLVDRDPPAGAAGGLHAAAARGRPGRRRSPRAARGRARRRRPDPARPPGRARPRPRPRAQRRWPLPTRPARGPTSSTCPSASATSSTTSTPTPSGARSATERARHP